MYIAPASSFEAYKDDIGNILPEMHKNSINFYKKNKDKDIKEATYQEALEYIKSNTRVSLTKEQLIDLLFFFPFYRIKLAVYGVGDTEVKSYLLNMVSSFFIGVTWPTYGDKVDIYDFVSLLRKRAIEMKYEVIKDEE
ncbi:hypothetical protein [Serratia sp. Se-RSBMAAmG]|uniref:hypothetical protein n=1 Tax=Serratia sp. Se-RSBMAAmG TaxID=3043305 RepID=UPI0024AFCD21|nr:hypothetical protein [Serratia sp. Se-RSBMAAmG]MDI6976072.1 hypothetical protein [Serratia sp. Se-RSBMAAmG]